MKKIILSTIFATTLAFSCGLVAYASGPTGTIWYTNPATHESTQIFVTNGNFTLLGITGSVAEKTSDGLYMVSYNNQSSELRNIPGVGTFQFDEPAAVAVKYGTTGTIFGKNGEVISIVNGEFTFKGVKGTLEMNGDYVLENGVKGNVLTTEGVSGYQLAGAQRVDVVVGTTGTITYKGKIIQVINGNFTIDNGVTGSLVPINGVYDGSYKLSNGPTIYNLTTTQGVDGYQIEGKPYVSLIATGAQSLSAWISSHQTEVDAAKKINDPYGHSGGVNDAVFSAWLKANPKLTASQILDDMNTYKIDFRQLVSARNLSPTGQRSLFSVSTAQWWENIQWFIDRGITQQELVNKGLLQIGGPADSIANGSNLQQAAAVGWVPLGVYFAYQYGLHPGTSRTDEVVYYSQKDLDVARGYEKNGYWGPDGTGDMIAQLKKAGYIDANNMWKSGVYGKYDRSVSGPNIADPATYRLLPTTQTSVVVKTNTGTNQQSITGSTSAISDSEANPNQGDSCANFMKGFGYRTKDTVNNDDVTTLQDFLHTNGYLVSTPTGFFGAGTFKAVKAFQKAYGISQTGYLGPNTRAKIKAIDCN